MWDVYDSTEFILGFTSLGLKIITDELNYINFEGKWDILDIFIFIFLY